VGGILATCSKEKIEDEMISHIRLNSLLVSLYINYAVLIVASLLVYDLDFLQVMIYQMFTILLVFMVVFRYQVWRAKRGADDEE
jgi:Ca2+-dependent lipid-binding protein